MPQNNAGRPLRRLPPKKPSPPPLPKDDNEDLRVVDRPFQNGNQVDLHALAQENKAVLDEAQEAYEEINGIWIDVEKRLSQWGVLKPTELQIHVDGDDSHFLSSVQILLKSQHWIGVRKISGKWRVAVRSNNAVAPVKLFETWTPICDCSIDLRVSLLKYVPALLQTIVASNRQAVRDLRKSAEELRETLKQFDF